ncbi:unnamed protein product [Didymodactylos carnosus]|uniref:Uncharacterized protein n=1 Tax=Didymodactylos carnosus TaxID=1234261 RepID=A0A815Y323_9BILA|nr:unnamed protein product [Didymodactylos carnosus]CAF1564975.1 unnamed protein product [Didymodactylos carnosus]CAF4235750.1 unnamed protein product [Didymodactylos carnosus]CAF4426969.1 unnamed protein product [Didymodactylos carnosus]
MLKSEQNLTSLSDATPNNEELINNTKICKKFIEKVVEFSETLATTPTLLNDAFDETIVFLQDPAVIEIRCKNGIKTKQKTKIVPQQLSFTTTSSTNKFFRTNQRRLIPLTVVSKEAEQYAHTFGFPPIRIIPSNNNNSRQNVRLNGDTVTAFLNQSKINEKVSFRVSRWRISSGNLLLYASDRDSFACLFHEKVYLHLIGTCYYHIELPKRLPAQMSLLILGVPSYPNANDICTDVQYYYPSVNNVHYQPAYR